MAIIRVLKNVPLDSSYTDTLIFTDISAQTAYFTGKVKSTYDVGYQRIFLGVAPPRDGYSVTLNTAAENVIDCNYLMMQNTDKSSKWYYAFITEVTAIAEDTCRIHYSLDHYQTYQFDITVLPSYVEREHTLDDSLYSNLVPEPLGSPDLYVDQAAWSDIGRTPYINIAVTTTPDGTAATGGTFAGIYSGAEIHTFTSDSAANEFIASYADATMPEGQEGGRLASIIAVWMTPYDITTEQTNDLITGTRPSSLNGYVPRNNKLFSYPYCCMELNNRQGQSERFLYEKFVTYAGGNPLPTAIEFNVVKYGGMSPGCYAIPRAYNGGADSKGYSMDKVVSIENFPQCLWVGDAFSDWYNNEFQAKVASDMSTSISKTLGYILGAAVGMGLAATGVGSAAGGMIAAGSIAGLASNLTGQITDNFNTYNQRQIEKNLHAQNPGEAFGSTHTPTLNWRVDDLGFNLNYMACTPNIAATIDDYFDMFGYQTNRLKVPNMFGRASWNYVKTNGVIINGTIPVQSMVAIKNMFNSGVRFWHGDYVGNYSRDNSIVKG